jgi:hypothetical protein
MNDRGPLLHNSGVPPRTLVKYSGLDDLSGAFPEHMRRADQRPAAFGTAVRFTLADVPSPASPPRLLRQLGIEPGPEPERQLFLLIDERADGLPLPDGCVVVPAALDHWIIWSDVLTALAVLAKCSTNVWLRAKSPSLHAALDRRDVSLLVPPLFAARLPQAKS